MENFYDWRKQAFQGQVVNIIDQQSFQQYNEIVFNNLKKSIVTINKSIVNELNPLYLFQEHTLKYGLSQQSKDNKCKIRIINKFMNQQIFRKYKCRGIEIERRLIKVNGQFQIELYPQSVELLYIDSQILQNFKLIQTNSIQKQQKKTNIGYLSVNFSEIEEVADFKDKIKRYIQRFTPKIQQIRIYCLQNSLFQFVDFNRYLEYYLFKEDIKYAEMDQRKYYDSINNRANDNFLVEFFPGKLLTNQSVKYLRQNGIKQLMVEGYISNKWVFPEQPLFSISKNCQFCSMRSHLYIQFSCLECKNVLMFCSRVCEYQGLMKHPCQSAKKKISLYSQQGMNIVKQSKSIIKQLEENDQARKLRQKNQNQTKRENQKINHHSHGMNMFRHGKGLHNLGNTCYMNSGIQIILSTDLNNILLNHKISTNINLSSAYIWLIRLLGQKDEKQQISFDDMSKFKSVIDVKMPIFAGFDQHDAQEFITVFLDELHNQLKTRPVKTIKQSVNQQENQKAKKDEEMGRREWLKFMQNGFSPVINLFYGQMKNQIKCLSCKSISRQFNSFNTLQLSIPSHSESNSIIVSYEFYQFQKQTTLITLACGNIKLRDLLNKVKRIIIKAQGDQNKRNLKIFLLGFEQTFLQFSETFKVKDLVGLIGPVNDSQRQLFILQPPIQFNVYIIAKFLNSQRQPFTFKRPLFFNTPRNKITNNMLYKVVTEYFISFLHLHDKVNQIWTNDKVAYYFKLRLQWETQTDQNGKIKFYGQGKLIDMNNEISSELSRNMCEVWIELQKFDSEDSLGLNFYKLLTTKFNKYVKIESSEKDKLNLDDQYLRLQECIEEQFSKKQYLSLENQVFCPICNQKKDIQKSAHPYKISRYLIIHLKRFKTGMDGLAYEKNISKIVTPPILNLENVLQNPTLPQKYYADLTPLQRKNYGLDSFSLDTSENYQYKLKGVILHQGSIQQGHYFVFAESNDGSWWKYNDQQVTMINIRQQLNLSLNMQKIYILMYERTK